MMRNIFRTKRQQQQLEILPMPIPVELADIHCHCLAGIDDGPQTDIVALEICRALIADGISTVAATPHQLGRFEHNTAEDIRRAVRHLRQLLQSEALELEVLPGGDVRVDERLIALLDDDKIMTLADQRQYILLELPYEAFVDITIIIEQLAARGIKAILTHPERHSVLAANPQMMRRWLDAGLILQLTAGSLLGDFGNLAMKVSWQLLTENDNILLAGDVHNLSDRRPKLRQGFAAIAERLGQARAIELCSRWPKKCLQNKGSVN